jgi:hypothetical protein
VDDLTFRGRYVDVRVHGKGRKERVLPLWKEAIVSGPGSRSGATSRRRRCS